MFLTFEQIEELPNIQAPEEDVNTYMDKDLKKIKTLNVSHSSAFQEVVSWKLVQVLAASIKK